jgi:hypothetical protein
LGGIHALRSARLLTKSNFHPACQSFWDRLAARRAKLSFRVHGFVRTGSPAPGNAFVNAKAPASPTETPKDEHAVLQPVIHSLRQSERPDVRRLTILRPGAIYAWLNAATSRDSPCPEGTSVRLSGPDRHDKSTWLHRRLGVVDAANEATKPRNVGNHFNET